MSVVSDDIEVSVGGTASRQSDSLSGPSDLRPLQCVESRQEELEVSQNPPGSCCLTGWTIVEL